MALRAVRTLSLADQVFEQLASAIVTGRYAPGTTLPAERKLVEDFDVNRHVVREALKRLEQIGLVRVTQGGGTQVLDFMKHAGLDLLALMADYSNARPESLKLWLAVHEMRAVVMADAAYQCARRGSPELKQELLNISAEMRARADDPELHTVEIHFWDRVIAGADNIAYRLAFNSLVKGAFAPSVSEFSRVWAIAEVKQNDFRRPIAEAIAAGDAELAERLTRESQRPVSLAIENAMRAAAASQPAEERPAPQDTAVFPVVAVRRRRSIKRREDPDVAG
jgi:GntR family transcriptional repressor for pyruvate dehydrogenase complex